MSQQRDIYTVSRLNHEAHQLLLNQLPLLWLEAEISNFAQPGSGHMYFSLKDAAAQIRAAMFVGRNRLLRFKPKNGMQVRARGRVALYEARGDFQFIVEHLEESGHGVLRRAFEALKHKLDTEGLFDESRKQSIPNTPTQIGVISSASGAAVRDVINVLKHRCPLIPVMIYPTAVQGQGAEETICSALQLANRRNECDILLLVRGGGSLEDLQAFNSETVARAIAASTIPVISGIGHEIDFTIADFIADLRAPTPSAAAERCSPSQQTMLENIEDYQYRLNRLIRGMLGDEQEILQSLQGRLQRQHPKQQLYSKAQRVDDIERRFLSAIQLLIHHQTSAFTRIQSRLHVQSPTVRLATLQQKLFVKQRDLYNACKQRFVDRRKHFKHILQLLNTVSPLATLERGYAIALNPSGQAITSAKQVNKGELLNIRLAKGCLDVEVK